MERLIIGLLKVLCPHLKEMAKKTDNKVDDFVVNLICAIAGYEIEEGK